MIRQAAILAAKDLRLLLRDRVAAFFTFAFPLAIAVFFGYVFSGTTSEPLKVAAFVERPSPQAAALVEALGADGGFKLDPVPSREEGERAVRLGRAAALIVVPAAYADGLDGIFAGGGAALGLVVDPSRRAEGAMLVGKVHEVAFRTVFSSMSDPVQLGRMLDRAERSLEAAGLPLADRLAIRTALARARSASAAGTADGTAAGRPGAGPGALAAWRPVRVDVAELEMAPGVPANAFAVSFMQGLAWGLFGAVLSFSSGIAEERQRGTLVRLMVSPMRPATILVGKAMACFAACMASQWLLVLVGRAAFGVEVSSWGWLAAASAATAFGFSGLMMLLAGGFRTQGGAQGAGRAVLLVLTMVGGGTVPLVYMPGVLRTVSDLSPFKWAVVAAEGCTWRGWGAAEMWLPLAALAAIGMVGLAAGAALVRRTA